MTSGALQYVSGGQGGRAGEAVEEGGHRVGDAVSQQLLGARDSFLRGVFFKKSEGRRTSAGRCGHLVGVDGVAVLVGVDHRQRDGHGVADEGDGHRVPGDVGEGAQGGEPGPGEPGGWRGRWG